MVDEMIIEIFSWKVLNKNVRGWNPTYAKIRLDNSTNTLVIGTFPLRVQFNPETSKQVSVYAGTHGSNLLRIVA